jgi:hypothetical protein
MSAEIRSVTGRAYQFLNRLIIFPILTLTANFYNWSRYEQGAAGKGLFVDCNG